MADEQRSTTWQDLFSAKRRSMAAAPVPKEPASSPVVPDITLPVSETTVYRTVTITSLPRTLRFPSEFEGAIDLLADTPGSAQGLAEGVLLTHEQAWRMKGVALGKLLHSLSLAPGEITQVAVTNWERDTTAGSAEDVDVEEDASQSANRDRTIHDVTTSVANEQQKGGSSASSLASQTDCGIGGVLGFIGGSAAASTNFAMASSVGFNLGSRDLSADSNQSVRESTQQHAANARGQRSAVVQEVAQSETEQFTTRVVANYNHMHALNMLYFEVLQVFELATRVTDAHRCIFLPMQVMSFDERTMRDFAPQLANAAAAMGLPALAAGVMRFGGDVDQERLRQRLEGAWTRAQQELERARGVVTVAAAELTVARQKLEAKTKTIQTTDEDIRQVLIARSAIPVTDWTRLEPLNRQLTELQQARGVAAVELSLLLPPMVSADLAVQAAVKQVALRNAEAVTAEAKLKTTVEATRHDLADILSHLNDRKLAFNQALWAQLDPTQVAAMLAGKRHQGAVLLETVDPAPVAVIGTFVGFRWHFPEGQDAQADAFRQEHLDEDDAVGDTDTVVLPTGGIFAEAVLGRANSAEKLDLTRFWRWDDNTIPILPTAISRLHQVRRAQLAEARPGTLGAAVVKAQPLPEAPAGPSHTLASLLGTPLFRDMGGSEAIAELLKAGQDAAAQGSATAQQQAHENISAFLDHLEELLPKVASSLKQASAKQGQPKGDSLDPSNLGALQNAVGEEGAGLDVESLLGSAAELGLFL